MLTFTSATASALRNTDYRILITGASGWLGRALLEMLAEAMGPQIFDRVILCGSKSGFLVTRQGQQLPVYNLVDGLALLDHRPTLVFHFAFLTKDQVSNMSEQMYVDRNRAISDTVAHTVASGHVAGFMLASSGAVYDYLSSSHRDGAANLYGRLKAEDEERFAELCTQRSVRFIAPRIFNISGPHINKFDAYALSAIIVDALRGGPITLRASKRVYRSYIYVGDLLELVMCRMLNNEPDPFMPFFDTTGDQIVEIGELAHKVLETLACCDIQIIRPVPSDDPDDRYVGNPDVLRSMLRHCGMELMPLNAQISSTADFIAQSMRKMLNDS